MKVLKKLLYLISLQNKKHVSLLLLLLIVNAIIDMAGIASILPFIAVLANPDIVETNIFLKQTFNISSLIFGIETKEKFLIFLGIVVFLLLVISLGFKALTTYLQAKFVLMCEYSISKKLIERYLSQPYSWFLSQNSSEISKTILSEVGQVVGNGVNPLMEVITRGLLVIAIITLLVLIDPKLAFIVGLTLGGLYGVIFYLTSKHLRQSGHKRLFNNEIRFKSISEAFGATKEIKIAGLEKIYIKNFLNSSLVYARTQAFSLVVSSLPRFILEAIAFGGILLIILYIMTQTNNFSHAVPIVGLYTFAGYRLMPALQILYASLSQIYFIGPSIDKIHYDFQNLKKSESIQYQDNMIFNNEISLNKISYNYPNSSRTALKDISLNIPIRSTVGIIGATGSGKTTTVDTILGLLEPQNGVLKVDGKTISEKNIKAWQSLIGYVPQNIYLSDDTVAANIAFGADKSKINQDLIEKVSKIAQLHSFVTEELPQKYETIIGERGVRLSGGQRQRIGIARALYLNPKLLVLDEATSALDNQTEKAVMNSINLIKDITIIIIAHRLNTVSDCDIIYKLDKGQIVSYGTFDQVIKKS
jgi:ABC-type multidrug transport system fused ATPase/permease subunit